MIKKIIMILISIIIVVIALFTLKYGERIYKSLKSQNRQNSIQVNYSEPVLAVFSFNEESENRFIKNFHHLNIKLFNTKNWNFSQDFLNQIPENTPILITIETWNGSDPFSLKYDPLYKLIKGDYDQIVRKICKNWIGKRKNVYIRFNPEMEVPTHRYPWQFNSKSTYIKAFRHFTELSRKWAPQVKIVWGSAGYPGNLIYYPGDEWVDASTVTIKSNSEMELDVYPNNYPVCYDIKRRIHRLRFIGKPIFVLGSENASNDSVNEELVIKIANYIAENKEVVYSKENYTRSKKRKNQEKNENFEIGFHDPHLLLAKEEPVTVEHIFADFATITDSSFLKDFEEVVKRGHNVIVTVEPSQNSLGINDRKVLKQVINGDFNKELDMLFSILSSTNQTVYLRFAHEMEIPITRYPWQSQDPVEYIKSFRYFMTYSKPWPENIKKVWGPAGDRGSIEWYPGDDVVDFVSIAIYGLPDKNITDPEKQESFETIFKRKNWRMRFIDKPLFITEFGVKGPEEYQTQWLIKAAGVVRKNTQIVGINYFNMTDTPKAWGDIKPPDWSISKNTFYTFWEELNK